MAKYAEFVVNINNNARTNTSNYIKIPRKTKTLKEKVKEGIKKELAVIYHSKGKIVKMINSAVGLYTGNKLATTNREEMITFASMALAIAINPYVGITTTVLSTANQVTTNIINVVNAQQESSYKNSYLGNMTASNSRWKGNFR